MRVVAVDTENTISNAFCCGAVQGMVLCAVPVVCTRVACVRAVTSRTLDPIIESVVVKEEGEAIQHCAWETRWCTE
jgi:hypothetical protein